MTTVQDLDLPGDLPVKSFTIHYITRVLKPRELYQAYAREVIEPGVAMAGPDALTAAIRDILGRGNTEIIRVFPSNEMQVMDFVKELVKQLKDLDDNCDKLMLRDIYTEISNITGYSEDDLISWVEIGVK